MFEKSGSCSSPTEHSSGQPTAGLLVISIKVSSAVVCRSIQTLGDRNHMLHSRLQKLASWVVCLGFIALGLLYLNGAFFTAWVAGGPPNDNPLGWEPRAIGQLSFSLASFILSIGSYKLIQYLPSWRLLPICIIVMGVALSVAPYVGQFILQDRCLDAGGQWSNLELVCKSQ